MHLLPRLALAATLLSASAAHATPTDPVGIPPQAPRWTVQVDPLTTALGFVHVQVERALDPRWSVYLGPHLRLFDSAFEPRHEPFTGLGVEVGVRRFLTGSAPEGIWLQIRGVGAQLRWGGQRDFGGYVSALGGVTHVFDSGLLLAGGLGVQYIRYTIGPFGVSGILPAAHTTLGFAF